MTGEQETPEQRVVAMCRESTPPARRQSKSMNGGLSAHILPTSATMIGVCLTALYISLLGPAGASRVLVDKVLAVDVLVFLLSAVLSFVSMRSDRGGRRAEIRAEAVFLAGLGLLAIVALTLAFAVN
jgi:hypothetical protein